MNITFLVNWDSASALALSLLIPKLKQYDISVFYTRKASRLKVQPLQLSDLAKFEEIQQSQYKEIFHKLNATCLNDINGDDFQAFANSQPDLVISIRHMSILKAKVINIPRLGVINLHSGLLPAYQGVMATFWAMKNKEETIGTTLHFIEDACIDTGAIISQSFDKTDFEKSYYWNVINIYRSGCNNIITAINQLNNGDELVASPQSGNANYFSYPTQADFDDFKWPLF